MFYPVVHSAAYDRFAAVSRATRDAAAAAEIRFVDNTYAPWRATAFAQRNADRVTSLGAFVAPDFASIQPYSQLRDLELRLYRERAEIAWLPRSLTKLAIALPGTEINWEDCRPLCCLQELQVYNVGCWAAPGIRSDDSFATALPLLRVSLVTPVRVMQPFTVLKITAKVVTPHPVELSLACMKIVHLDLHFMSALKSLSLLDCYVNTVSAACSTMRLEFCRMSKGLVLVTPNLRSLTIDMGGGLPYLLDASRCRHALSIVCKHTAIEWIGAKPDVESLRDVV